MTASTETAKQAADHTYLSKPSRVREDRRFVTGNGRYVADITPPEAVHVGLVTSPFPPARIVRLDDGQAVGLPGVVTVLSGAEPAQPTQAPRQSLAVPEAHCGPLAVESPGDGAER